MYKYLLIFCICIYILCVYKKSIEHATFEKGIDAIINIGNNHVYIFRKHLCLDLSSLTKILVKKFPRPGEISSSWRNVFTKILVKENS